MIRLFTSPTQRMGQKGEQEAVRFLKKQGFKVIDRNVANKFGEIDVVARKKGIYHFFEVKTARQGAGISAAENLTPAKLRKFLISAEHYALVNHLTDYRTVGILVELPVDPMFPPKVEIIELF